MPRSDRDLPPERLGAATLQARAARLRALAEEYPQDPGFQALVRELAADLEALTGVPDSGAADLP